MDAVEHQRKSDRPGRDRRFHSAILRIEAAHEAKLDEPSSERGFRIEDRRTIRFGGRHRLFAEDRLARPECCDHMSCVRLSPRCDDDRINLFRRDELFAHGISLCPGNPRRNLLRSDGVGVADCDDLRPDHRLGQPTNVLLPNSPNSDDADVQCHGFFFLPPGACRSISDRQRPPLA
jgi:hypothetical protein